MPSIPGTINFPASLDDAISLIEPNNNASSTLTAGISNSDLSIPVADPAEFSASGFVTLIDNLTNPTKIEIAIYTSKSGSNLIVPSGGRGAQGTTAQSWVSGNYVEQRITARHHTVFADALIAIETKLGTGSDTAASGEFLAGSGAGISGWRALLAADIPDLSATYAAVAHTHTFASLTSKPTTLSGYGITDAQPLDGDLTAIAALSPSNDDIIQRKAGAWTNRTPAQFKTDLALVKADVGLGNVENTALSTWAGSTSITTLGTITTGVWNGTAIANANLANSAITIAGTSVSLGSSISLDTITGLSTTGVVKRTGANTLAIAAVDLSSEVTGDLPFANFVQAGSAGFVGATGAGDYSHRTPAQVTAALDAFVGDSGSGGTKGLVPAPASGDAGKYLKGDGTWATVSASPAGSTGDYQINNGGSFGAGVIAQGSTGRLTATPTAASSGVAPYLRIVTPADTGQTADTEFPGIFLGGNASGATVTRTGADGTTYALQREIIAPAATYAFAGATTVTLAIGSDWYSPIAGSNATLTKSVGARFNASNAAHVPLVANGATSQSANIFETQINGSTTGTFVVTSTGSPSAPISGYTNSERFGANVTFSGPSTGSSATLIGNGISITSTGTFDKALLIGQGITATGTKNANQAVVIANGGFSINPASWMDRSIVIVTGGTTGFGGVRSTTDSVWIGSGVFDNNFSTRVGVGGTFGSTPTSGYYTGIGYGISINSIGGTAIGSELTIGTGHDYSILMGRGASSTAANQFIAGSNTGAISDVYFGKGVANATPTAYAINGTGGSGSNIAGANLNLAGGKSTGTGRSGYVALQTSVTGSTGSSTNSLVDRQVIPGRKTVSSNNSALGLFEIALPTLTGTGGTVRVTVYATDGTDVQSRVAVVRFSGVNKGGSYTVETAVVDEAVSASAGTLTATYALTSGTNKVTFEITPNSSLTTTVYYIVFQVENNSEQSVTIL